MRQSGLLTVERIPDVPDEAARLLYRPAWEALGADILLALHPAQPGTKWRRRSDGREAVVEFLSTGRVGAVAKLHGIGRVLLPTMSSEWEAVE